MSEKNKAPQEGVKVEDLLRLKRAEQPDEAFWNNFDRELHQRMLQTLVKKDPWYVQVLRGVTGRIAQTAALGSAAVFLTLILVRPVLVDSSGTHASSFPVQEGPVQAGQELQEAAKAISSASVEVVMSDLDSELTPDYRTETMTAARDAAGSNFKSEYDYDTLEVASYDRAAYVTDTASFAGSGLATTLVY